MIPRDSKILSETPKSIQGPPENPKTPQGTPQNVPRDLPVVSMDPKIPPRDVPVTPRHPKILPGTFKIPAGTPGNAPSDPPIARRDPQLSRGPPKPPGPLTRLGVEQRVVHGGHKALRGAVATAHNESLCRKRGLGGSPKLRGVSPNLRGVPRFWGGVSPMLELRLLRGLAQVTSGKKRRSWE